MECIKSKCKHYDVNRSHSHGCNYCLVVIGCIIDTCPIEDMILHATERLTKLKVVQDYLREEREA